MSGRPLDVLRLDGTPHGQRAGVEVRSIWVGNQRLVVAIKRAVTARPPLLLFNGIGANWELAEPFLDESSYIPRATMHDDGLAFTCLPVIEEHLPGRYAYHRQCRRFEMRQAGQPASDQAI